MHLFIFGHPFALLVALILLPGVAFHFLNKKKTSVSRNVEDADTRAFGSLTVPTKAHSSGSSSSPIETYNNASSLWASSLTVSTGNHYDVFLSFRGLDTRQGFTDHLYNGLVSAGVCTFRDDDELCQGKEIGPNLLAAIKNSNILIPVLSENYGSSKWCLDELVQMMECNNSNTGHLVLPIFYKVEPTHVRHQTERFGVAFRTRERLSNPKSLEKWKQALVEVSSLKGWEANRYEGDLVKSIVQKVLSELKKKFELIIPEKLVGIDSHVEKIMEFLNNDPHATLYVGIYGMGGIGKTTLAKVIYNKLFNQFESSFIADIRESCKRNGLEYLQNQLISDILKHKGQVHNKDQGTKLISSQFKSKRVFILLDDVDDDDQLKALVGNYNWFSSGSRIIITTRNKSILDNARVDYPYELEEMDKDKSLILFCRHAFRMDSPPNKFEKLTHDVVSTTRGLPLSLEILGSFLCGKEPMLWRGTINKLREVPHKKVREKLRISYEALEHGQKQIFLDIACFFIGTSRRIASYMWDACGFFPEEGIEVLRFMSLIKVGNNHELRMHDQLRDLGREIIREENQQRPEYRSRLWDPKEGLKLLKENKEKNIEAICLSSSNKTTEEGDNILTGKQFKKLRNLRFLDMSGAHFSGDFKDSFEKLRWLRWQNCPLTFEAKNIHVKELVVLELSRSEISDRWQGWSFIMMAKKLKFLDLTHCQYLKGTFFLSAFKNLEVLILKGCWNLEQIDFSIGDMKSLVRLNLSGCVHLKELPVEMSKLEALEQLNLMDCRSISILPDNIGALQNLEILDIHRTRIKELPNSIGALQNLKILNISVTGIKELPGTIGTLQNLESLNISVTGIKELPSNIGTLQNLESLNISDTGVEKLPNGIGRLRKLQKLDASWCRELQSLPKLPCSLTYLSVTCQSCKMPSLSHLPHLKELHLINCKYLKCVLELPSTLLELSEYAQLTDVEESELQQSLNTPFELEILEIFCCESMDMLDVSQLNNLKTLSAQCCCNVCEVRGLDKLKYLESVTITGYTSIKRRLFPKSKGMKKLHVENCQKLVQIQGLDSLEFFDELCISNCASIERLDLPKSESMKKLGALYCEKLGEIQGLDKLRFLEKLSIIGCPSIKRLDLSKSMDLKVLNTQKCKNLLQIQGLNILGSLKMLYVSECASIKRLDLSKSEGLKVLHTENCENLIEIQGLHRLGVLAKLDISGCISIEKLNLPKTKGLKVLNAENCENLVEIQDLDRLEFLVKLYISGCTLIERLDLSKSKGLKKLIAQNCKSLIQIQGLNRLEFLEKLCISGCASIKRLDLPKSKSMKILDTQNCKNLVKIEGLHRLDSLEELHISGCSLIEKLDFPKSKSLKILEDEDCKN